jgi:hypothetical protein
VLWRYFTSHLVLAHTGEQIRDKGAVMKVLLVEDSKLLRVATEQALTSAGYEVVSAGDGDEAVRLAREHTPSLILLDVMLPKMSGPDVAGWPALFGSVFSPRYRTVGAPSLRFLQGRARCCR